MRFGPATPGLGLSFAALPGILAPGFFTMSKYRIGIDLGGTKIEGILLDSAGQEVLRKRVPTDRDRGYWPILHSVKQVHDELLAAVPGRETTFGIGTPGAHNPVTGHIKNSNTVCMNGMPVKADLEKLLNRPIEIQNDANCFAMAEALLGAGVGKKLVFGVILGTGCGGGIVHHGEVLTGLHGFAAEWGHHSLDVNGPKCFCGQRGCTETYISGGGLQARYVEKYGVKKTFREIEQDYRAGQPQAVEFIQDFYKRFGQAINNLIAFMDPDIVILGGGVSKFELLYTEGLVEVERHLFSGKLETPIVKHQIGDSAGVIGAALVGV